jgi:Family of unknown function (DUF6953)
MNGTTPAQAARWMLSRLEQQGRLCQAEAVCEIAARFGGEFTFATPAGRMALDGGVRRAFKKLTRETVVWDRQAFCWRWRRAGDAPGRGQELRRVHRGGLSRVLLAGTRGGVAWLRD